MKRACAAMFVLALAACGPAAEKGPAGPAPAGAVIEPFDLHIEIGRYGAMLSQVHGHTFERPGAGEANVESPRELARALRETVWEYNLERSRLCAKGLFTEVSCGPALEPVWLADPASAEPSLEELKGRGDAVGREVMRLWNAVCEDAAARVQDEQEKMYVCAME